VNRFSFFLEGYTRYGVGLLHHFFEILGRLSPVQSNEFFFHFWLLNSVCFFYSLSHFPRRPKYIKVCFISPLFPMSSELNFYFIWQCLHSQDKKLKKYVSQMITQGAGIYFPLIKPSFPSRIENVSPISYNIVFKSY
jgi:hypothetical protein